MESNEILNNSIEIMGKGKRPIILTIFCFLGIFGFIWNLTCTINPTNYLGEIQLYFWHLSFLLISLVTIIGVWKMKVWSISLYLINNLINQHFLYIYDHWNSFYFIGPLIWLTISYVHYKRMD